MAVQVSRFAVTVPAGTTQANPQKTRFPMPPLAVALVRVRVPPGPSGFVGFVLAAGGTPLIPANVGTWVVADNEEIPWELDDAPDADTWELWAYNADVFDHTIYVMFDLVSKSTGPSLPQQPLPLDQISSGPVRGV